MYEIKPLLKKEADSTLKDMTLPTQRGFAPKRPVFSSLGVLM